MSLLKEQHLAITSVPFQAFENLYDPQTALSHGTAFPQLNLPFYINSQDLTQKEPSVDSYPGKTDSDRQSMKELTEVSFLADDLNLYLDTHPDDEDAFCIYKENIQKRQQLLQTLSESGVPLSCDACLTKEDKKAAPCPWKGVNQTCGIMKKDCSFQ